MSDGYKWCSFFADLYLYSYERDFIPALSNDNKADIIEAFNSSSGYLDDLLNIDNRYFEGTVNQIYPPELKLDKAYTSDSEVPFLDRSFRLLLGPLGLK